MPPSPFQPPYSGTEGILAWIIDPRAGDLHVRMSDEPPSPPSDAVEREWRTRCEANPRLYDGAVLSVQRFHPETNEIVAVRDSFKRLTVQPRVHTGVQLLAVTAVLEAADAMGRRFVLMGQRSRQTRIYGGQWEVGPSGGVSPPPPEVQSLSLDDLCRSLADEVSEEIGMQLPSKGEPLAYIRDLEAFSDDIIIRFRLGALEDVASAARPANWEYEATVWMPIDSVSQFDGPETIAATRAAFRMLGLIDMF